MEEVRRLLRRIEGTKVGSMLLGDIRSWNRWVRIEPYWWGSPTHSQYFYKNKLCNASSTAHGPALMDGRIVYSIVNISPERWAQGTPCAKRSRAGAVSEVHEILFHELVHVLRHVSRKWSGTDRLGGGVRDQNNFEEFIAILVTNIYASCNGKKALRAGHADHSRMPSDLTDSFRFFEISAQAFSLIEKFHSDHPEFAAQLATVEAPFNPIWAHRKDADRARRLSEGAKSKNRDAAGDMLMLLENLPFSPITPRTQPIERWVRH
jgi:hypothetical protein